jgi:RND family efflux transporter MFP subunit
LFRKDYFLICAIFLTSCESPEVGSGNDKGVQGGVQRQPASPPNSSGGEQREYRIPLHDRSLHGLSIGQEEVTYRELPVYLDLHGKIQPEPGKEVDVNTRILGRVLSVAVHVGDSVKAGQLLAILDSKEISELEAEVIEAKSRLRVAIAQRERERQIYQEQLIRPKALITAKADFQQAKAQLELSEAELERQDGLRREKIASDKSYMEAKTAAAKAQANFTEAKLALQREEGLYKNQALMKKDLEIAEAEAARAGQHLDTLKQRLVFLGMDSTSVESLLQRGKISGELRIVAPVSGVISYEDVAVGEVVHTDLSMFKILDLSSVVVQVEVPEVDISFVRHGDPVLVTMPSYPHERFEATISYVAERVNPESHSFAICARLSNRDHKFKANMSADIELNGPKKNILACPKVAIADRDNRPLVFLMDRKNYIARLIKTGVAAKEYVEVLDGLNNHDRVVTLGKQELSDIFAKRR